MAHKAGVFRGRQKAPREPPVSAHAPTLEALLDEALNLHQAGNLQDAEALYRRILALHPDQPVALHALGAIAFQAENLPDGFQYLSKAAEVDPENADLQNDLGTVLMALERPEAAEACYRSTLRINPAYAEAHYNLGIVLAKQEKVEAALESFRNAIRHKPDYAGAYYNLGLALHELGRLKEAAGAFTRVTQLMPYWADAHHTLGDVLQVLAKPEAAEGAYRKAIQLNPCFTAAHFKLGSVLQRERVQEAMACYREALRHDPTMVLAHLSLGSALKQLGQFDEALACFKAAGQQEPTGIGFFNIAQARRFSVANKEEIAALESMSAREDMTDDELTHIHFALGKVYDDCGLYDQAFAHYSQANSLKRSTLPGFDPERHIAKVSALIDTYTEDLFARYQGQGSDSELPVFIMGTPRSGTTLVEQILAAHPRVHGAGELVAITNIVKSMSEILDTPTSYPECMTLLTPELIGVLAEGYLEHLREHRDDSKVLRVTDKMPGNIMHLGLIAILFPRARGFHLCRDPLDACLSMYFQSFAMGHEHSYDLADLATFYRQYQRLMAHWRHVLPGRLIDVDYEALVSNQEVESRRLVAQCGLDWDDACLEYYEHDRPVRTASDWQVRQPIYKTSVKRWKNYEKHLQDLISAING